MLASVKRVRVLQKIRKEYDGNIRFYVLLGDGQSDLLKFRIDDAQQFEQLQPFDTVNVDVDLYSYDGRMYAAIKSLEMAK